MNKTYRLIWNELLNAWVAVSEIAKARGKKSSRALLISAALAAATVLPAPTFAQAPPNPPPPTALPTGGNVVAGTANIAQSGAVMNITQATQRAAIDWQTFNVGSSATVNFLQPSSSAVALNRVLSGNPSQIFGQINANGQVFLTNPSGVYFAPGSSVNVGALVATTHSISNADFMAGNYKFSRNGATGSVINEGNLTADLGGYIALLAPEVRNNGIVIAQAGTVALAAGETFTLQMSSNNTLASIDVEPATIAALVENGHAVQAPGGVIILSAQAADRLQGGVVKNTGSLEATGLVNDGGTIRLLASDRVEHTGSINVDAAKVGAGGTALLIASLANPDSVADINGSISARGGEEGGDGGFVETSGTQVNIGTQTQVSTAAALGLTGTWLIDPNDFTVAASGGNMTGTQVSNALAGNNFAIATATMGTAGGHGDIHVNDTITWSANRLTLTAERDININAVMTAKDSASLTLTTGTDRYVNMGMTPDNLGFTGRVDFVAADGVTARSGTGFLTINGNDYTVINSDNAVQDMNLTLNGNFALGSNVDLADVDFTPIGFDSLFTGNFDGLGHTIDNLMINRSTTDGIGLFGWVSGASLRNIGLTNVNLTGEDYVGGLAAGAYGSSITNAYVTGTVDGTKDYVGGLVGYIFETRIQNSYATATVTGRSVIGGLVGAIDSSITIPSIITNVYATGDVTGREWYVGGLVGTFEGSISNAYATGDVKGGSTVGGLVGENYQGEISNAYATGDVFGIAVPDSPGDKVGGLVGGNFGGEISNAYATGAVTGAGNAVGGLVGFSRDGADTLPTLTNVHATGTVTASGRYVDGVHVGGGLYVGGLVGEGYDTTIENAYATGAVNGAGTVGGLVGHSERNTIRTSYASGVVTSMSEGAGGLVGYSIDDAISDVYATGAVTGTYKVGGLVGLSMDEDEIPTITNAYATGAVTGAVTGTGQVGGLVGYLEGTSITTSYWDIDSTGQAESVGGPTYNMDPVGAVGIYSSTSTVNAYNATTYSGFNFTTTWYQVEDQSRPFLRMEQSTTITNAHQLQLMSLDLTASYTLAKDLNLATVLTNQSEMWKGTGTNAGNNFQGSFVPVGDVDVKFTGSFDGQSHTISNLVINLPSTDYVGLFGYTVNATIRNIGLTNVDIQGFQNVGGLVGRSDAFYGEARIENSYATGTVSGASNVGGLVGWSGAYGYGEARIENSYATGTVSGDNNVGGLVGYAYALGSGGTAETIIAESYATVDVTGTGVNVGGWSGRLPPVLAPSLRSHAAMPREMWKGREVPATTSAAWSAQRIRPRSLMYMPAVMSPDCLTSVA